MGSHRRSRGESKDRQDRGRASQRRPMVAVIKHHDVYDAPFWRDSGLNGRTEAMVTRGYTYRG
jgi:hypothetical protein